MNTNVTQENIAGVAQPVRISVSAVQEPPQVETDSGVKVAQLVSDSGSTGSTQGYSDEVDVFSEDPFGEDSTNSPDILAELTEEADSQPGRGLVNISEDGEEGSLEDEPPEIGLFTIFHKKCLRCKYLVPELTDEEGGKSFKKCHFTAGNEDCPAKTAQIIVGVPTAKIVNRILDAEQAGESELLATIYAKLATKDPNIQALVHEALATERTERMLQPSQPNQLEDEVENDLS